MDLTGGLAPNLAADLADRAVRFERESIFKYAISLVDDYVRDLQSHMVDMQSYGLFKNAARRARHFNAHTPHSTLLSASLSAGMRQIKKSKIPRGIGHAYRRCDLRVTSRKWCNPTRHAARALGRGGPSIHEHVQIKEHVL